MLNNTFPSNSLLQDFHSAVEGITRQTGLRHKPRALARALNGFALPQAFWLHGLVLSGDAGQLHAVLSGPTNDTLAAGALGKLWQRIVSSAQEQLLARMHGLAILVQCDLSMRGYKQLIACLGKKPRQGGNVPMRIAAVARPMFRLVPSIETVREWYALVVIHV